MRPFMQSLAPPLVALNAHLLTGEASYRSAGISTYLWHLLEHLSPTRDGLRYLALTGPGAGPLARPLPMLRSRWPTQRPLGRILWEQLVLPLRLRQVGAALLHAPAFVGPLFTACPQVITVHDLSFLRYPAFFRRSNRLYLSWLTGLSCRRARAVIAVSRFTAQEVQTLLRVPAERIHVVYHGVEPRFHPLPPAEVERFRREQGLPERFILFLGTLEPRKNLLTLVRAFAQLAEPTLHLVLAGARGWFYETLFAEMERLGVQERVHCPGYIAPETQPLWYNAAEVFAYISHYEGFGLPVLEALACGVPTLTSATTALPEVTAGAALAVSPEDLEAITAGLRRLLDEAPLREQLRQQGRQQAARFTWTAAAEQTAAVYRQSLKPAP